MNFRSRPRHHGYRECPGWDPLDTWSRYAHETFAASSSESGPPYSLDSELVELEPRSWWRLWWGPRKKVREAGFGQAYVDSPCGRRHRLPTARVIKR